jgi:hypothetical protein
MRFRRPAAAWLLSVPLMVAGSQVAHTFAYRLVYPEAQVRLRDLVQTGHGYLSHAPFVAGVGGAIELVAFVWILVSAVRGRRASRVPPPWAFALLPPLAFVLQEVLERWLLVGSFPWWAFLQPTFAVGLALQLPFALLAYVAARLLVRAARTVAPQLRGTVARPWTVRLPAVQWAPLAFAPLAAAHADGHPVRGPPALHGLATHG